MDEESRFGLNNTMNVYYQASALASELNTYFGLVGLKRSFKKLSSDIICRVRTQEDLNSLRKQVLHCRDIVERGYYDPKTSPLVCTGLSPLLVWKKSSDITRNAEAKRNRCGWSGHTFIPLQTQKQVIPASKWQDFSEKNLPMLFSYAFPNAIERFRFMVTTFLDYEIHPALFDCVYHAFVEAEGNPNDFKLCITSSYSLGCMNTTIGWYILAVYPELVDVNRLRAGTMLYHFHKGTLFQLRSSRTRSARIIQRKWKCICLKWRGIRFSARLIALAWRLYKSKMNLYAALGQKKKKKKLKKNTAGACLE